MAYDNVIDRSSASAGGLVPCEQAREIISMATAQSAALTMFKRVPILTNQKAFPVLASEPSAYFLDKTNNPTSDTALIQTTEVSWKNTEMQTAEVAVICPIPRRLLNDVRDGGGINLTQEIAPRLAGAIARTIDGAVFFGINKPVVWPTAIVPAALAAGNTVEATSTATNGGLHADVIKLLRTIRADGFLPNVGIGRGVFEFDLMDARDNTGQPLFIPETQQPNAPLVGRLLGRNVMFGLDGVFPADAPGGVQLIMMDSSKFLVGVREDFNVTVHTDGVIQDATGAIQYNLFQQDIIALRVIMRVGIAVANPVTDAESVEANRYPAGVLVSDDGVA